MNHEAYDLAFIKRMLTPHPTEPGAYLGNTQRREFIPLLKNLFKQLPAKPQIFDVANDEPFDFNKLVVCGRFVETYASEIGLTIESRDVPQKGMVRSNQPQIVSIIRKRKS